MDIVEKLWLAGKINETLTEVRQVLAVHDKAGSIPDTNALLLFAFIYYQLGNLHKAADLLNRVKFDVFDVKEWIVENNKLVLKYLENRNVEEVKKTVASACKLLHEKIQGLPCSDVCFLELNVCFNYGLVILCSHPQRVLVPGGLNCSQAAFLSTLDRVCTSVIEGHQTFNLTIEEKLQIYFQNEQKQKEEEFLVASLVWLLSCNLLVNSQVSEARKLAEVILDFFKPCELPTSKTHVIFTLLANSNRFQDSVISASHLLVSYSAFILKNKTLSVKHTGLCLNLQPQFINGLFFKGLLLYEREKYEDSVQCLQKVISLSNDKGCKATALNILGCIFAKKDKPQTAVLKFRESFACHPGHLEALYNVVVVYHDNGNMDLEISLCKEILKMLSHQDYSHVPAIIIDVECISGITMQAFGDFVSEDHYLISTDIHCMQSWDFKNFKLSIPSLLFKIAHNCFFLERYTESSKFYGQLLRYIRHKPVDFSKCRIANLTLLYKEFAEALFKCGSYEHSLVVCEKILGQELKSKSTLFSAMFSQDSSKSHKGENLIKIMLCKASVLKELQKPIEANECYESILDVIHNKCKNKCVMDDDVDEPAQKRRKRELGSNQSKALKHESNDLQKLKALTLRNQSELLLSLGRKKEAMLLKAQCISCGPSNTNIS